MSIPARRSRVSIGRCTGTQGGRPILRLEGANWTAGTVTGPHQEGDLLYVGFTKPAERRGPIVLGPTDPWLSSKEFGPGIFGVSIPKGWLLNRGGGGLGFNTGGQELAPDTSTSTVFCGPYTRIYAQIFVETKSDGWRVFVLSGTSSGQPYKLECFDPDTPGEDALWTNSFGTAVLFSTHGYSLQYDTKTDLILVTYDNSGDANLASHFGTFHAGTGLSALSTDLAAPGSGRGGPIFAGWASMHNATLVVVSCFQQYEWTGAETYDSQLPAVLSQPNVYHTETARGRRLIRSLSTTAANEIWSIDPRTLCSGDNVLVRQIGEASSRLGFSLVPATTWYFPAHAGDPPCVANGRVHLFVSWHNGLSDAEAQNFGHWEKAGETFKPVGLLGSTFDNQGGAHPSPNSFTATPSVSLDCRFCRASIVALDPKTKAVRKRYDFPALDAADSDHYVVDQDTFDNATLGSNASGAATLQAGLPNDSLWNVEGFDPLYETILAPKFAGNGDSQITATHVKRFPQWKYWTSGAGYYCDPIPGSIFCLDGITSGIGWQVRPTSLGATANAIAADKDGNLYLVFLQPYGVISPRESQFRGNRSPYDANYTAPKMARKVIYNEEAAIIDDIWIPVPYRHIAFRSFLLSLNKDLDFRWKIELTTWHNDLQFASPSLVGKVPYAGTSLRLIVGEANLFLLRTKRRAVAGPVPNNTTGVITPATAPRALDVAWHNGLRYAETWLESYSLDGELEWAEQISDGLEDAEGGHGLPGSFGGPAPHVAGWSMVGSRGVNGNSWVCGRIVYGTDLAIQGSHAFQSEFTPGKLFVANATGLTTLRSAVPTDMGIEAINTLTNDLKSFRIPTQGDFPGVFTWVPHMPPPMVGGHVLYGWNDETNSEGNGAGKVYLRRYA